MFDVTSGIKQAADELVPLFQNIIQKVPDDIKGILQEDIILATDRLATITTGFEDALQKDEEIFLNKLDGIVTRFEILIERLNGASVTLKLKDVIQ